MNRHGVTKNFTLKASSYYFHTKTCHGDASNFNHVFQISNLDSLGLCIEKPSKKRGRNKKQYRYAAGTSKQRVLKN